MTEEVRRGEMKRGIGGLHRRDIGLSAISNPVSLSCQTCSLQGVERWTRGNCRTRLTNLQTTHRGTCLSM